MFMSRCQRPTLIIIGGKSGDAVMEVGPRRWSGWMGVDGASVMF